MRHPTTAVTAAGTVALVLATTGALAAHHQIGASMIDTGGNVIGKVMVRPAPTGVLLHVEVDGLPPGPHAIHIHAVGACEPDFKASGGHVNVRGRKHGLLNADGPDDGDLPNIHASADGSVRAEIFTDRVRVESGDARLLDADGSAFVIHEGPDDHVTQPIGGAGGRIACGVIERM